MKRALSQIPQYFSHHLHTELTRSVPTEFSVHCYSTMDDLDYIRTPMTLLQTRRENRNLENAWVEEIVPGLFLGNIASSYNKELLQDKKITAIVSLTSRYQPFWDAATTEAGITPERHMWAQVQDSRKEDLLSLMKDICDFIDSVAPPQLSSLSALPAAALLTEGVAEHVAGRSENETPPHAVLIHCACGISRSSTIIAAYLMRKLQMERDAVLQFVKSRKDHIHPNLGFYSQLELWHESQYTGWENKGRSLVIWSCLVPD